MLLILADVVILTIQAAPNVFTHPRPNGAGYFHTWEDWALFVINILFSIEIFARILVAGLIYNPIESAAEATADQTKTLVGTVKGLLVRANSNASRRSGEAGLHRSYSEKAAYNGTNTAPTMQRSDTTDGDSSSDDDLHQSPMHSRHTQKGSFSPLPSPSYPPPQPYIGHTTTRSPQMPLSAPATVRSFSSSTQLLSAGKPSFLRTQTFHEDVPFVQALQQARQAMNTVGSQKAYLRHSWNRVDMLAVACYWVSFALAMTGVEAAKHIYVFRAISVLRAARLLTITSGTTVRAKSRQK